MPTVLNSARLFAVFALTALSVSAQTVVTLQNATATFSQTSCAVGLAIDGDASAGGVGWAISPNQGTTQIAAFETASDIGGPGGSVLNFTLTFNYLGGTNGGYELGRFRISTTTDDRSTFADGLNTGGDVTANWTVLTLTSLSSAGGATMTLLGGDSSVLVSGTTPSTDVYTFSAITGATAITGIRLEAIPDASLPSNGPGRQGVDGNFVVSEFAVTVTAIPEPSAWAALMGVFVLALAARRRRTL